MKPQLSRIQIIIGMLALINIAIHLAFYDNLEYHRDELLYFAMGLHPDFGYATTPPLISWLASVLQFIFGNTLFAVKILPALASGFMVILAVAITRELGGKFFAQVLTGVTIIFMPFTLRTFHLFQPVFLDLTFWTLILYFFIRYLNSKDDKYLFILGCVIGLSALNKYLVGILLLSLLIALLLTRQFEIFKKRNFYYAAALALVLFLPNLIWQITNDLRVIRHLQELNRYQLLNVDRVNFLIDQLLMPFAGSLVIIPGLIYLLYNKKYRVLGYSAIFVILILLYLQGKSYYTLGVFPVLVAAGAVAIEKYVKPKIVQWSIPVIVVLLTLPILPMGLPVYNLAGMVEYFKKLEDEHGLTLGRRFEDGSIHSLPQDYADQIGWEELTKVTYNAYKNLEMKDKTIIFADNYGEASAISIIGKKYRLPEALSFNDTYWYWKPENLDPGIQNLIYINNELGDDVAKLFNQITIAGSITNKDAREYGTKVYLCQKPKRDVNILWHAAIARESR